VAIRPAASWLDELVGLEPQCFGHRVPAGGCSKHICVK
jgi:hypothetical protein